MSKSPAPLVATIAFGAAVALAAPSWAQGGAASQAQPAVSQQIAMGPGMGMEHGYGMHYGACRGGMMGIGRGYGMMYHTDGSLAFLKAELRIMPNQMQAWEMFATTMRDSAEMMRAAMLANMMNGPPATFAAGVDRHEAMMIARLESLRMTKAALVPFYSALTSAQKEKLDDIVMPCGQMAWGPAADGDESGE